MGKILILLCAVFGAMCLIDRYWPGAWNQGFHVQGTFISIGLCVMLVIAYMAYRLKSK